MIFATLQAFDALNTNVAKDHLQSLAQHNIACGILTDPLERAKKLCVVLHVPMLDAGIIAVWFLDSSVLALDFRHRSRFAVADVGTRNVDIQLFRSLVIVPGSRPRQVPAFAIPAAYLSLPLVLERVRLAWGRSPPLEYYTNRHFF